METRKKIEEITEKVKKNEITVLFAFAIWENYLKKQKQMDKRNKTYFDEIFTDEICKSC